MEVKITVKEEIKDGVRGPKRYDFSVRINYGTGDIKWSKDAFLHDLDAETVKELVEKMSTELEKALKI